MKAIALRLLALAASTLVAVVAWIGAATLRPGFAILAAVALLAFLACGFLLLRRVDAALGQAGRTRTFAWLAGGMFVYVVLAHLTVGRAPERVLNEPVASPDVAHWTTPDGDTLAYLHTSAAGEPEETPVIMLHDGPGIPALPTMTAGGVRPLDFLARDGYPVYYYDQRGAGYSSRIDLRYGEPYTVGGHVADLEFVRTAVGGDRVVLIGHGWGATLALQYLLRHPERVDRVVALSPAPVWYPAYEEVVDPAARVRLSEVQASALALLERPPLRLMIGRLTAATSRVAAHSLVPDWEADQWWTRVTETTRRLGQPNVTCNSDPARNLPPIAGLGFFAYSYTSADALRLPDPRPALERVETPLLIVRGLCDYIRSEVAYEYLQLMPGAQYVAIPGAGHLLWPEQREMVEKVVKAFLAGEPVPLSLYHPKPVSLR